MATRGFIWVIAGALVAGTLAIPAISAASCNNGTSEARDYSGTPETNPNYGERTGEDKLADLPDGGWVYGSDGEGSLDPAYLGVYGPKGFVEVSGHNDESPDVEVDGATNDGALEGRGGVDAGNPNLAYLCVNGTQII